jgi:biopolymer transport protein ExbD
VSISRKKRRSRQVSAEELNVAPLMNLFVAIVPLLLLSAVFVSISSIDLSAPTRSESVSSPDDFVLAVRITPQNWWVDARGAGSVAVERNDTDTLWSVLDQQHRARPEHTAVLVACAEHVEYEEVIRVLDVATLAGFPDCALVGIDAASAPSAAVGEQP